MTRSADLARITVEQLGERLAHDERLRDVVAQALARAREIADEPYREAIARLVAAATDKARIDVAAYVLEELTRLQPVHLRLILFSHRFLDGRPADGSSHPEVRPTSAAYVESRRFTLGEAQALLEVEMNATRVMLGTLVSNGYLKVGPPADEATYDPAEGSLLVVDTLFPHLEPIPPESFEDVQISEQDLD